MFRVWVWELQQHMERKAKREVDRLLAAAEAETIRQERAKQVKATRHAHNAGVLSTFKKRGRETTLAVEASAEAI